MNNLNKNKQEVFLYNLRWQRSNIDGKREREIGMKKEVSLGFESVNSTKEVTQGIQVGIHMFHNKRL